MCFFLFPLLSYAVVPITTEVKGMALALVRRRVLPPFSPPKPMQKAESQLRQLGKDSPPLSSVQRLSPFHSHLLLYSGVEQSVNMSGEPCSLEKSGR